MNIKNGMEKCVTVHNPSKAYGGYTLFTQHYSKDVWMIDMQGRVVQHWDMPAPLGGPVRLLPNGNQMRINKTYKEPTVCLGTVGGKMVEVDWDGKEVWKHEDLYMHHDYHRLANGNTILLKYVEIPADITAKIKGGLPGTEGLPGTNSKAMWGDAIQEITPEGKVVWEWIGYEQMDTEIDVLCPLCPRTAWAYFNGLNVLPNGDIVVSARLLNCLFIIDKKTKKIKWRWGRTELGHQHNPTVLENGNILVFDNGFHRLAPQGAPFSIEAHSRVLEINPKNDKIEWLYQDKAKHKFFSAPGSGTGRLPNGNTLICEMVKGRIFEVTPESEIVWEFISPFYEKHDLFGLTNTIFQAHRYGYDYPGLQGKQLDPERFELVIREKGKQENGKAKDMPKESEATRRLRMLGY